MVVLVFFPNASSSLILIHKTELFKYQKTHYLFIKKETSVLKTAVLAVLKVFVILLKKQLKIHTPYNSPI